MDKNTITGLLLMAAVFFGFMYCNKPSKEALERQEKLRQEQLAAEQARQEAADTAVFNLTAAEVAQLKTNLEKFGGDSAKINSNGVTLALVGGQLTGTVQAGDTTLAVADVIADT